MSQAQKHSKTANFDEYIINERSSEYEIDLFYATGDQDDRTYYVRVARGFYENISQVMPAQYHPSPFNFQVCELVIELGGDWENGDVAGLDIMEFKVGSDSEGIDPDLTVTLTIKKGGNVVRQATVRYSQARLLPGKD